MKATLHHYFFRTDNPEEKTEYEAMRARIKANEPAARGRWMHTHGQVGESAKNPAYEKHGIVDVEIDIETVCIFDNQWNSATLRVFDWYEAIWPNSNFKSGHWLELTPELAQARLATFQCGYCGKMYGPLHSPRPDDGFCTACLDSPYLKETELYLLRVQCVKNDQRKPLCEPERAELIVRYVERQTTGADSRNAERMRKQSLAVHDKYNLATETALDERNGMLWLHAKGIDLDNVIYYKHTRKFGFGWRSPLSEPVKSKLLEILSEFPHAYEFRTPSV